MAQPHAVQQLRLDLHTGDAGQARRLQDRLSELCRQLLPQILDEELSRSCPPNVRLVLPQLALDLGSVPDHRLEAELPDLLRRALRAALQRHLPAPAPNQKAATEALSVVPVLEYFLLHGCLPWQVNAGRFSLVAALQDALTQHAAAFLAMLLRHGRLAHVRQRLAQELRQDQMLRLIGLLEPVHAPFIRDFLLTTLATHRRQRIAPLTETALQRVVYELVLTDLLVRHATTFNRRTFVEGQIRRLAAHYNLSFDALLRRLVDLTAAPLPFAAQSALPAIIRIIYQDVTGVPFEPLEAEPAPGPESSWARGSRSDASRPAHRGSAATAAAMLQSAAASRVSSSSRASHSAAGPAGTGPILTVRPAVSVGSLSLTTQNPTSAVAAATQLVGDQTRPESTALTLTVEELVYFLRHGSLPVAAAACSQAQVQTAFARVLTQGWPAVRRLLQRAGTAPAAATLARYWPEPTLQLLLRQATAGHLRAYLAAMQEATAVPAPPHETAANSPHRQVIWQRTFSYLADSTGAPNSQHFGQWLHQQATPNGATETAAAAVEHAAHAQEIVFHFLRHGQAPAWLGASGLTPAQLTRILRHLLQTDAPTLRRFIGENALRPEFRQHLAVVADVGLLARLLGAAGISAAGRPGQLKHQDLILTTLERLLPGGTPAAPSALRRFLRAAYLAFVTMPARVPTAVYAAEIQRVAAANHLPWRALLRWLAGWLQLHPELLTTPFLAQLAAVAAQDDSSSRVAEWPRRGRSTGVKAWPDGFAAPPRYADGWSGLNDWTSSDRSTSVWPGSNNLASTSSRRGASQEAARKTGQAAFYAAGSGKLPVATAGPQFTASTDFVPRPVREALAALTGSRGLIPGGSYALTPTQHLLRSLLLTPQRLITGAITPRAAGPLAPPHAGQGPGGWATLASGVRPQLGGQAQPWPRGLYAPTHGPKQPLSKATAPLLPRPAYISAVAAGHRASVVALVLYLLQHGRLPAWWHTGTIAPAQLRQLFTQAVRQQPRVVRAFLRRLGSEVAVQQRVAALADFEVLIPLLGLRPASQRAAPALIKLTSPGNNDAFGQFLRAAYVAFHWQPAASSAAQRLGQVRRLAAAYRLPWRALLAKTVRLSRQQPILATEPLFAALERLHGLVQPPLPASASAPTTSQHRPLRRWPRTATESAPVPDHRRASAPQPRAAKESAATGATNREQAATAARPAAGTPPAGPQRQPPVPDSGRVTTSDSGRAAGPWTAPANYPAALALIDGQPKPLAALPTGEAARDLVFYYLLHHQLPWWGPADLSRAQLRKLLAQVAHHYRSALRSLVREQLPQTPALSRLLAELASFSLLTQLLPPPSRSQLTGASSWSAARLDTLLTAEFQASDAPIQLFLKETYLAFSTNPGTDGTQMLASAQRRAAGYGLSWRAVLRRVGRLHQRQSALATVPFFAWLLAAQAAAEPHPPRPKGAAPRTAAAAARATLPGAAAAGALSALEQYLQTGRRPPPESSPLGPHIADWWPTLLRPAHRAGLQRLRPLLAVPTVRERLLRSLPAEHFFDLLRLLYPRHYRMLARLVADWQLLAGQGLVRLGAPALFELLLTLVQATPAASFRPETLLHALLAAETPLWPQASPTVDTPRRILREVARRGLALRGPLTALLTWQQHQQATVQRPSEPAAPSTSLTFPVAEETAPLETVYVANAGLVLLWPFLSTLFNRLGYLRGPQFRDADTAARAAVLLQFLVSGDEQAPEFALPLNKLLCGIRQPRPLLREPPLTDEEKATAESLLGAVIAQWTILKSTSLAGLRETFLMRQGKLEWLEEDRITLTVEPRAFDMLLDQRPWSISIVKLPWMPLPLYVTWR